MCVCLCVCVCVIQCCIYSSVSLPLQLFSQAWKAAREAWVRGYSSVWRSEAVGGADLPWLDAVHQQCSVVDLQQLHVVLHVKETHHCRPTVRGENWMIAVS